MRVHLAQFALGIGFVAGLYGQLLDHEAVAGAYAESVLEQGYRMHGGTGFNDLQKI